MHNDGLWLAVNDQIAVTPDDILRLQLLYVANRIKKEKNYSVQQLVGSRLMRLLAHAPADRTAHGKAPGSGGARSMPQRWLACSMPQRWLACIVPSWLRAGTKACPAMYARAGADCSGGGF